MENTNKLNRQRSYQCWYLFCNDSRHFLCRWTINCVTSSISIPFCDLADCMRYPYDAVLHKNQEIWNAYHYRHHWRYLLLFNRLWLDRPARLGARRHSKRCCAQNRRLSEIQGHCSELCLLLPRYHGLPRQSLVCR